MPFVLELRKRFLIRSSELVHVYRPGNLVVVFDVDRALCDHTLEVLEALHIELLVSRPLLFSWLRHLSEMNRAFDTGVFLRTV